MAGRVARWGRPAGTALALGALSAACAGEPAGTVYVTSGFEDRIYVLDAADGSIRDTVETNRRLGEVDEPHGVAVAPESGYWYATLSHGDPTLWKFELGSNRLVGRVTLPQAGASRIGMDRDGTVAVVPDYFRSGDGSPTKVTLVGLRSLDVRATAMPCTAPHDAVFAPDGETVAITCVRSDEVVLVDPATLEVRARHPVGSPGSHPMNLVWTDDGLSVLVTVMGENRVARISAATGAEEGSVDTGIGPAQIARTPDGRLVATANRGDASLSLIDVGTLTEIRRVSVPGEHPHGVAFDGRGERLFLTYEGTTESPGGVVAVDRGGTLLWHVPLGVFTLGVAWAGAPAP